MTTVKHFHSTQPNAPVSNGQPGSLIAILDACLVNGFGEVSASSLTVSSNVATVVVPSGHSFEPEMIALVSGATPSGLNGEKRIISTTTTSITFSTSGIADQVATGSITVKLAPAGWEKVFSGTNLAVYRSTDPSSTRMFLRVDDTGTINARVVGYENMTDVNTGTGRFPTESQVSGGGYWGKSNSADSTARYWQLFANSSTFYIKLHTHYIKPGITGSVQSFGDFKSLKAGDRYACRLYAHKNNQATSGTNQEMSWEYMVAPGAKVFVARSYSGLGGSLESYHTSELHSVSGASGYAGTLITPGSFPNVADNGLVLSRKVIVEPGVALRGFDVGALLCIQNAHNSFNNNDTIDGTGQLSGRKLKAVKCGSPSGDGSQGVIFVDITGPWN